jgi:hypothetical protein
MSVNAVKNAQTQRIPTLDGITKELDKLTATQTNRTWLKEKLTEAESAGLIKEVIGNRNDEPIIQWVNQVPPNTNFLVRLQNFFRF